MYQWYKPCIYLLSDHYIVLVSPTPNGKDVKCPFRYTFCLFCQTKMIFLKIHLNYIWTEYIQHKSASCYLHVSYCFFFFFAKAAPILCRTVSSSPIRSPPVTQTCVQAPFFLLLLLLIYSLSLAAREAAIQCSPRHLGFQACIWSLCKLLSPQISYLTDM